MKISKFQYRRNETTVGVEVQVSCSAFAKPVSLWFRTPRKNERMLSKTAEVFAYSLLPISMYLGEDLEIEAPITASSLPKLRRAVRLMSSWKKTDIWPGLPKIKVHCTHILPDKAVKKTGKRAAFFSLGVDSFFTLQECEKKASTRLSHLILGLGFDIRADNTALFRVVKKNCEAVAKELGKTLLLIETNINHDFSDKIMNWELVHGGVLAGVASFFSRGLDTVYMSTEDAVLSRTPYGVHVDLAPLWSTHQVTVALCGTEYSRSQKTAALVEDPLAHRSLRVCWENRGNAYNCGVCPKCVRTILQLQAAGGIHDFSGLPSTVSPALLRSMVEPKQRFFLWWELLRTLPQDQVALRVAIVNLLLRSYRVYFQKKAGNVANSVRQHPALQPIKIRVKKFLGRD